MHNVLLASLLLSCVIARCLAEITLGGVTTKDAAEDFMASMYEQYQSDRYSHPMADTVRTLLCLNDHDHKGYHPNEHAHLLEFNISRITSKERVNLAELRVYIYVDKHSINVSRTVRVFSMDGNEMNHVVTKDIMARKNGWHNFDITTSMVKWLDEQRAGIKKLKIKIEKIGRVENSIESTEQDHVAYSDERHREPIIVVFSERKFTHRIVHVEPNDDDLDEVSDLLHHNTDLISQGQQYDDDDYADFEDEGEEGEEGELREEEEAALSDDSDNNLSKRQKRSTNYTNQKNATLNENSTRKRRGRGGYSLGHREKLREASISSLGYIPTRNHKRNSRLDRQLRRRRTKSGKNHCRRRPMYVNFGKIKWGKYIFAPKGYQAYECVGKCSFPLPDRSTPTKHAIIQTIIHDINPGSVSRTCCVPTRLTPISLLYENDGVITYKYKYENMVVAECGCR